MAEQAPVAQGALTEEPAAQLERLRAKLAERQEILEEKERLAAWCRDLLEQASGRMQNPPPVVPRPGPAAGFLLGWVAAVAWVVADPSWALGSLERHPIPTVLAAATVLLAGLATAARAVADLGRASVDAPEIRPLRERLEYAEGAVRVARRERDAVQAELTHARGQLEVGGGGLMLAGTDGGELAMADEGGLSEVE